MVKYGANAISSFFLNNDLNKALKQANISTYKTLITPMLNEKIDNNQISPSPKQTRLYSLLHTTTNTYKTIVNIIVSSKYSLRFLLNKETTLSNTSNQVGIKVSL